LTVPEADMLSPNQMHSVLLFCMTNGNNEGRALFSPCFDKLNVNRSQSET